MPEKDVLQYMNIIPGDGWEHEKRKILESLGFQTKNIVNLKQPRITSATEVRNLIKENENWQAKVPEGTIEVLLEIHKFNFQAKDLARYMLTRTPNETVMAMQAEAKLKSLENAINKNGKGEI